VRIVTNSYCQELFVLFLATYNAMRAPLGRLFNVAHWSSRIPPVGRSCSCRSDGAFGGKNLARKCGELGLPLASPTVLRVPT
jgi:hypothetical protein